MEIIKANKPKLIRWLRGDELILQHVQSKDLITKDEYAKVNSIQDPSQKTIEILDLMLGKGDEICRAFLEMLKDDDVNESSPELKTWIDTVDTSSSSSACSSSLSASSIPEDRNEVDNAEPQRKRFKMQTEEVVVKRDNRLNNSLDLKTSSTMAKLEEWVSHPKNNQKLIDDLEKKLDHGEMEGLKDYLKDKKLKKSLCLTAKEINEIRKRNDLCSFLKEIKAATFLGHFFEKVRSKASTAKKNPEQDRDTDDSTKHKAKLSFNADQIQQAQQVRTSGATEESKEKQEMNDTVQNSDQAYCPPQTKLEDVPPNSLRQDIQLQSENSGQLEDTQMNTGEELKKDSFCSTSSSKNPELKKKKRRNVEGQPNRKIEQSSAVLRDWLMNQCGGSEEEFKKLFDRISVKNIVEHSEYPFFIAENVMVFENPQMSEEQIIVVKDEKKNAKETTSLIHYQMFVCDILKTVLLGSKESKEQQISFDESKVHVKCCLRSILEVFVPALAVFKNIQRKERLDSYLKTIEGFKENPR